MRNINLTLWIEKEFVPVRVLNRKCSGKALALRRLRESWGRKLRSFDISRQARSTGCPLAPRWLHPKMGQSTNWSQHSSDQSKLRHNFCVTSRLATFPSIFYSHTALHCAQRLTQIRMHSTYAVMQVRSISPYMRDKCVLPAVALRKTGAVHGDLVCSHTSRLIARAAHSVKFQALKLLLISLGCFCASQLRLELRPIIWAPKRQKCYCRSDSVRSGVLARRTDPTIFRFSN